MPGLLRTFFLILLFFINSTMVFAAEETYVFDPLDSHHTMYIPEGQGRFPAVLMLHASTGVEKVNHDWATILKNNGYVVYVIDSFKPRGWVDRVSVGWDRATAAQLSDVVPAFHYLSSLPYVNPKRIAVLGFSMGGFDVLRIMEQVGINPEEFQTLPFKAAASFYGVCHRLAPQTKLKDNTTIFIGQHDDRATTADCVELVKRSSSNQLVHIKIYAKALHGFDNFQFPPSKEVIDERGEHYHIGFNPEARLASIEDLLAFFKKHL